MKKSTLLILAFALCTSCLRQDLKTNDTSGQYTRPTAQSLDTDSIKENDSLGQRRLYIALSKSASKAERTSMLEYISESLGGNYTGKLDDTKQMLQFYHDQKQKEFHETYIELDSIADVQTKYESDVEFMPLYESKHYTTLYHKGYEFWGGAHGSSVFFGQTFRKKDGRRIGWEVFHKDMNNLIRAGLKQYFEVSTDEDLKDCLIDIEYLELLPLPICPPLFTKEGIMFVYQQYEIAPYSAGMPSFTMGYDVMKKYMMQTALQLIEE